MKHSFATIIFVLLLHAAFGQKIHFTDTGNLWRVFYGTCGQATPASEGFLSYLSKSDTVLGSVHYCKFTYAGGAGVAFYSREDTIQKKVYIKTYLHQGQGVDTNELLLYNYNLVPGDTMRINWPNVHATYRVASIDSVLMGNHYYKVWEMKNDSNGSFNNFAVSAYYVIEGIGCLTDPQYPIYPYFFEGCRWLTCFYNKGQALPLNRKMYGFDNAVSCTFLGVKETSVHNVASVYPNPANTTSAIELKQAIANGWLQVNDILGREVYNRAIDNELKIPVGMYLSVPGQYFFKVTDRSNGQIYTGKFIFE